MANAIQAGTIYVNRAITGARLGIEPFRGFRFSGTGPKTGSPEYLMAFVTRRDGRTDKHAQSNPSVPHSTPPTAAGGLRSWESHQVPNRVRVLEGCIGLIRGEYRDRFAGAVGAGCQISAGEADELATQAMDTAAIVVDSAWEISKPQSTTYIPGQKNYVSWETRRGMGLVATDDRTPPTRLIGMVLGSLLAGNAVLISPSDRLRPLAAVLSNCLRQSGVPKSVIDVEPDGGAAPAIGLVGEPFQFCVTDLGPETTRRVYEQLAKTQGGEGQHWIKALIIMDEGPRPGEPGFVRLFAIPETVVINTLRHGADLDIP